MEAFDPTQVNSDVNNQLFQKELLQKLESIDDSLKTLAAAVLTSSTPGFDLDKLLERLERVNEELNQDSK